MNISLSPDQIANLSRRASEHGFEHFEDYVHHLLTTEAAPPVAASIHQTITNPEEWKREFQLFLKKLKPRNAHVDDSRDAIYEAD